MITEHVGEAALPDLETWANGIIRSEDDTVQATESYHDADSKHLRHPPHPGRPGAALPALRSAGAHPRARARVRKDPPQPCEGSAPPAGTRLMTPAIDGNY